MNIQTLEGPSIKLEPLSHDHEEGLALAAEDGELWKLWFTSVPHPDRVTDYIDKALAQQKDNTALPFAVREKITGQLIGSTRFCNADAGNRQIEIGYTWYAQRFQRTHVNTESKWLMLRHAFEQLHSIAVTFRTHWLNHRSRKAIERLGAKQDGVLRNNVITPDGSYRDTVIYSIIESEWPAIEQHLTFKLQP